MESNLVECRGLSMRYGGHAPAVLSACDFAVSAGEFVVVYGRSGSGKSTLLNLLGAMDQPSGGQLRVAGFDLTALNETQRTRFRRRHLGFVFQSYNLVPTLSVEHNLTLPLALNRIADEGRVARMLASLALQGYSDRFPEELSGGEQQRVAIGRALIHEPTLVLADEPTGNLDAETGSQVLALMHELVRNRRLTLVMATHSAEAVHYADRAFQIRHGRLVPYP